MVLILFMEFNAHVFLMAFRDSFHDSFHGVYLMKVYFTLILFPTFTPTFILVERVGSISIQRVFQIHDFTNRSDFDFL